jgi:hypothetical protein
MRSPLPPESGKPASREWPRFLHGTNWENIICLTLSFSKWLGRITTAHIAEVYSFVHDMLHINHIHRATCILSDKDTQHNLALSELNDFRWEQDANTRMRLPVSYHSLQDYLSFLPINKLVA